MTHASFIKNALFAEPPKEEDEIIHNEHPVGHAVGPPEPLDNHSHSVVQHDHPAPPVGGYSADIDALARYDSFLLIMSLLAIHCKYHRQLL